MFSHSPFGKLSAARLRQLMWVFFLAMALPTAILVYKSWDQLKWEAFYQHRLLAEELASRIDQQFVSFVQQEQNRSFADYQFATAGSGKVSIVRRSPLSEFPYTSETPGIIGYFQIDGAGRISTPLIPESDTSADGFGLSSTELQARAAAQQQIIQILNSNQLVEAQPAPKADTAAGKATDEDNQNDNELLPELSSSSRLASAPAYAPAPETLAQAEQTIPAAQNQAAFDRLSEIKKSKVQNTKASPERDSVLGRLEELEQQSPYKEKLGRRENAQKKLAVEGRADSAVKTRERLNSPVDDLSDQSTVLADQQAGAYPAAVAAAPPDSEMEATLEAENVVRQQPSPETDQRDSNMASNGRAAPELAVPAPETPARNLVSGLEIFAGEIDPFEASLLESGHFVLYRKVWRNGQRYIQGLLVEQSAFVDGLIGESFNSSLLAGMSTLSIIYQGNVLASFGKSSLGYSRSGGELQGSLLARTNLSDPFTDLQSVFTVRHLPAGAGSKVVLWAGIIMALVLGAGIYLLYRLSLGNLSLVNQQQDFVSAVSHELKTPLTSIRMYGEILQQGWADEEKKKGYYRYIFDESERLTRLINNVLALARMTRNETPVNLKTISVAELVDTIHSKVDSQIERSAFALELSIDQQVAESRINVDPDIFAQIIINLVDNALKFSADCERKSLQISAIKQANNTICFTVRDFGPGIEKDQLKKIFKLFYRSENELTRETTGTGIGLALVSQLMQLMNGKIDVVNRDPGVEFRLYFAAQAAAS